MGFSKIFIIKKLLLFLIISTTLEIVVGAPNPKNETEGKHSTSQKTPSGPVTTTPAPTNSSGNSSIDVTIYSWSHFKGVWWTMDVPSCVKVPGFMYIKASSIDTHGHCVVLHSAEECRGKKVTIAPGTKGHSSLEDVDFDNALASLEPCKEVKVSRHKRSESETEKRKIKQSPEMDEDPKKEKTNNVTLNYVIY